MNHMHTTGVFNVSNKLFVSLDIFFNMRCHIRKGEPPGNCAQAVLDAVFQGSNLPISSNERRYLEEKLYDGYFTFEAITDRDWDHAVCGICGVAPVFQTGDGNSKNCTPLKRNQVYIVYITLHYIHVLHYILTIH